MAAGMLRRAMLQLVQIGFFQSGLFLIGVAVAIPVQTSLVVGGSACKASHDSYSRLAELNVTMLIMVMSSMVSAMLPIYRLREDEELSGEGRPLWTVRLLRVAAFVAVAFSLIAMILGCLVAYHLVVVKTTLASCWSATSTAAMIACYCCITLVSLVYYGDLFQIAVTSD